MSAVLAPPAVPSALSSAPSPLLARCLLLALLLHVWLLLLLGNAPGGTAREGQGVWGAINITLRGPETPGAAEASPLPLPEVPSGPPGAAPAPRWGGAVRELQPVAPPEPGAAQVGDWARRAAPEPPPAAAAPAAVEPALPLPLPPAASAEPPPPPGRVLEERAWPAPAAPSPPLPSAPALPAAPTPQALPPLPLAPDRSLSSPLSREPPRAVESLPLPLAPQPLALRAPEPPQRLPELAPLPAPLPAAEPVLRQLNPPAPVPVAPVVPVVPVAPVAPLAPLAPVTPLTPLPQAASPNPLPRIPAAPPNPGPNPNPGATPAASPGASPSPNPGAPDAGARVGHDVATPPSAAASVPPRLNLELARPRGGELSRGRTAGVLPLLPRPPDTDKLGREIEKAAKADCRNAHAGAGLLAVVPLAVDALRKDGCKW